MKKYLIVLFAFLGVAIGANAAEVAECRITGGTEGTTVIASIIEYTDTSVKVSLDNDGTFAVNVTVVIERGSCKTSRGVKVYPSSTSTVEIKTSSVCSEKVPSVSVSGTRCNN